MTGVRGRGGPTPKRSDQVRRRNLDQPKPEHAQAVVKVDQPSPPADLTGRGLAWYRSLATSGQAVFYVDSDWQVALLCAHAMMLFEAEPRATMLAEIRALQSQLLATEGERRRARLELDRGEPGEGGGAVASVANIRGKLTG